MIFALLILLKQFKSVLSFRINLNLGASEEVKYLRSPPPLLYIPGNISSCTTCGVPGLPRTRSVASSALILPVIAKNFWGFVNDNENQNFEGNKSVLFFLSQKSDERVPCHDEPVDTEQEVPDGDGAAAVSKTSLRNASLIKGRKIWYEDSAHRQIV